MITYKCNRCDKLFNRKTDYTRHLNRKNKCDQNAKCKKQFECSKCHKTYTTKWSLTRHTRQFCKVKMESLDNSDHIVITKSGNVETSDKKVITIPEKNNKDNHFICDYCSKSFTNKTNKYRHIRKYCKEKIRHDEREKIYQSLIAKVNTMENEITNLKNENTQLKIINNNNTINNTINNNNNNTYNIQLVAYGQEQLDHLTDRHYKYIINKGFKSIQELVKFVHFNKNKPENHNVYISNMRDCYVMIYNGKKWLLQDRDETINDIYDIKKSILVDKFDEFVDDLPEYAIKKFNRFINDEQDDNVSNNVKREIKTILYNNKNIPENTKKKLGIL